MYIDEFKRLKDEFRNLAVGDDGARTQLINELENVILASMTSQDARRYIDQLAAVPFDYASAGQEFRSRKWGEARLKVIGIIDGAIHQVKLIGEAKTPVSAPEHTLNKAFLVHGQDHAMLHEIEAFVRRIGMEPVILLEEASRGRTVIEKVEDHADVPFAVVLFSPDDVGRAASAPPGTEKPRARQNAVLEAGFFIGKLGRQNVTVVVDGEHDAESEYPSDLAGVVTIRYVDGGDWKTRLMREFKASGLMFDPGNA